jgi:hypothetical protein
MSTILYGKISKKNKNLIFVKEKDFKNKRGDYEAITKGVDELDKIQEKLYDLNFIPEKFSYHNVCLWWFLYNPLVERLIDVVNFIDNFTKFIEENNPKFVKINDDFNKFEIIKQICNNKKITIKFSRSNYLKFKFKLKILKIIKPIHANYIHKIKIKSRKNIFHNNKKKLPNLTNKDIFVSYAGYRRDKILSNYLTLHIQLVLIIME